MRKAVYSKLFALGFAGAITLIMLSGCGSEAASASEQTEPVEAAPAPEEPSVPASPGAAGSALNIITVNSSEKVTVTPDIAQIVIAVQTQASDAASCQERNTQDTNQVIELLKGMEIAETSIQTSDYYLNPRYNYQSNVQKIVGYGATTTLTVSDLPIDQVGDILTKVVSAGANQIQSITYLSGSFDEKYNEALKKAVNSALVKAQALAEAGGCTVGGVVRIVENAADTQARYTDYALANKMNTEQLAADAPAAEIMPGQLEVEANITVEYQIQ